MLPPRRDADGQLVVARGALRPARRRRSLVAQARSRLDALGAVRWDVGTGMCGGRGDHVGGAGDPARGGACAALVLILAAQTLVIQCVILSVVGGRVGSEGSPWAN